MELEELLTEIEEANALASRHKRQVQLFNQPNLIAISSVNKIEESVDETPYSQIGFYQFQVNLPRPALEVQSLQLLQTNIPQANANIPNTACVFWYYRLSKYSNPTPNIDNLYYVRLLPSFYKQETIATPNIYGYNQTFTNYSSLSTQLAKASVQDLAVNNYALIQPTGLVIDPWYIPFIPNDVSIAYNTNINKFQMTGLQTQAFYIAWNSSSVYSPIGRGVKDPNGSIYFGYIPLITNRNVPPTNREIPTWVNGTHYYQSNIITHSGITYNVLNDIPSSTTPPPTIDFAVLPNVNSVSDIWRRQIGDVIVSWVNDTIYPTGRIVEYNGVLYKSVQDDNINQQPDTELAYWEEFEDFDNWYSYFITGYNDPNVVKLQGEEFYLEWNASKLYQVDEAVYYNDKRWTAVYQNQSCVPTFIPDFNFNTTYSRGQYVYYGELNTIYKCLVNGTLKILPTQVSNWSSLGTSTLPTWSNATTYYKYEQVKYNGYIYQSLQDGNLNNTPIVPSVYWNRLGIYGWKYGVADLEPYQYPKLTGLYGISYLFDMLEIGVDRVSYPFPYGVAGQPFNPKPKRLLNSILGFTWNGSFNPALLDILRINTTEERALVSNLQYQLFNKLRPIPLYFFQPTIVAVGVPTSSVSLTYTADAYANLVYSSIVNIYINAISSSSVDTQKDINLVAITSMNCANLGVAFWSNYVDNPLLKVKGDLYSLVIELRDEFGDPFYLTNNAVATLSFKATYE